MNDDVFKRLKDSLPWGAQAEVAKKHGVTPSTVSQVLSGDIQNDNILQSLIDKAKEYKMRLSRLKKQMEAL